MFEHFLGVIGQVHGYIISGEPAGHGWLLGIGMLLFYATTLAILWGLVKSITQRDVMCFLNPIEKITHYAAMFGMVCVPVMSVSILYEVISRYAFNAPTIWVFEISYMLMGISLLVGIAYCAQLRKHIRVDFLYDNVSTRTQALIDTAGYIILLIPALSYLTWWLFEYWIESYVRNEQTGESAWNPLLWPFKFFFVFGIYLFLLQIIAELVKCVMTLMGREAPQPNVPKGFE